MIYIFWALSIIILIIIFKEKQKNRIEEINDLIDNLNSNNYKIPMKQDEFSILEDKIYKLFIELVEQREKTKNISVIQSKNIEDIAHQIKTPITAMLFSLENGNIDNSMFHKKLNRLNNLSKALLKLSSFDVNGDDLKKDKVNITEVIDYCLDILSEDIDSKDIVIENNVKNSLIDANFYWLTEAFINIIKNAIYIKKTTKIEIDSSENPIYLEVVIKDNGGGISEEIKKNIFKRFYKSPDSNGFGIGLAITKDIIIKHNGSIEVNNIADGARFKIKFYKVT